MPRDKRTPKTTSFKPVSGLYPNRTSGSATASTPPGSTSPAKASPPSKRKQRKPSASTSPNVRLLQILERSQQALQQALQAQQVNCRAYAALAASQAEQIKLVLQERFFRPILTDVDNERQSHEVGIPAAELTDVTEYPEETDRAEILRQHTASAELEQSLEDEFKDLLAEQEAAHAR